MCYNAEDLLPICEELDVPLVFGVYLNNSQSLRVSVNSTQIIIMTYFTLLQYLQRRSLNGLAQYGNVVE